MRMTSLKVAFVVALCLGPLRVWAQAPGGQPQPSVYSPGLVLGPSPRLPVRHRTPLQKEDEYLALTTRLSEEDIHRLRLAAGIADTDWTDGSVHIDDKHLGQHRVLLTIYTGSSLCLTAEVFAHHGRNFQQLWSLSAVPGGPALCPIANCPAPWAAASKPAEVVITVPAHRDGAPYDVCDDLVLYTYRPAGASFALASQRTIPDKYFCTVDSQLYDAAFFSADSADRLAWIEVTRSPGGPPSAIIFQKTPDGPVATQYSISRQVWNQYIHNLRTTLVTPSECVESAKSASLERTRLPLTGEQVQALLDRLATIDLQKKQCPHRADGKCVYIMDGVRYFVWLPTGKSGGVSDTRNTPGLTSENPALSDWVYQVLALAGE